VTGSAAAVGPRAARPAVPQDHVLVRFGATGDLAKHKLLPGLFHLAVAGMMPERYRIVGSGRPDGALDTEGLPILHGRP
jgi:glucose-6-phosphate 1-dehydrogenase